MADQLILSGWDFSWYSHNCQGVIKVNPNIETLPGSLDFKTVKEIIFDEFAEYCFRFKVTSTYKWPVIEAELCMPNKKHVFLNDSIKGFTDTKITYNPLLSAGTANVFSAKLFWPGKIRTDHDKGTYKIQVNLGWKESSQAGTQPKWSSQSLPPIQIDIVDVITENPKFPVVK
jgi:hypothetical protein